MSMGVSVRRGWLILFLAAMFALAGCREQIEVHRAERLDTPISAASHMRERVPVPIGITIPRAQLRVLANHLTDLEFIVRDCGSSPRYDGSELFLGDQPLQLFESDEAPAGAHDLLIREADATGKGPEAVVTVLIARSNVDSGNACGHFDYMSNWPSFSPSTEPDVPEVRIPGRTAADIAARSDLDCNFVPSGAKEMTRFKHCATLDSHDNIRLADAPRARLSYESDGLARVFVDRWYVVDQSGHSQSIATFDNGPEAFSEGVARSPRGPKMALIDAHLSTISINDGALPFRGGSAPVCDGCTLRSDGEHSWYEGGRWTCVNRKDEALFYLRPLKQGEDAATLCERFRPKS